MFFLTSKSNPLTSFHGTYPPSVTVIMMGLDEIKLYFVPLIDNAKSNLVSSTLFQNSCIISSLYLAVFTIWEYGLFD